MINQHFVIVGALFNLVGSATYAFNTIKGKTKPNHVTWFLWALAPLIAFAAQLNEGVTWAALMTFMVGFGPLIIFISSFVNRKAYWKITKLDIVCGGGIASSASTMAHNWPRCSGNYLQYSC